MKRNAASPLRGRWRRMLGLTWLDDDDTIVPNAAKVQSPAPALDESATGVSFIWPRDTDLTREQIEVAVGDRAAAAPSPTLDAGRTVETTAHDAPPPQVWTYEVVEAVAEQAHVAWSGWTRWMIDVWSPEAVARWERQIATPYADLSESEKESDRKEARAYLAAIDRASVAPRPQRDAADWIERAQPGSTVVLGGIVGTQDKDGSTVVWSDGPAVYGHGETAGAAMRDYAESVVDVRDIQRRYGDAFDGKAAIRQQQAHAERGDAGDGHEPPPDYDVWSR